MSGGQQGAPLTDSFLHTAYSSLQVPPIPGRTKVSPLQALLGLPEHICPERPRACLHAEIDMRLSGNLVLLLFSPPTTPRPHPRHHLLFASFGILVPDVTLSVSFG